MSIAAAVIMGIGTVITSLVSGKMQSDALSSGQDEARTLNQNEIAQRNRELKTSEKLTRDQMRQNKKQFEAELALSKEGLAETKNVNARNAFREQYSSLTSILDKNENLKNIFTNRMKALRG